MPASRAGRMPVPIRKSIKQGGARGNEENVSAQEAPALQGAWLPQAYAHDERPQGTGPSPRQGPRALDALKKCFDENHGFHREGFCRVKPGQNPRRKKFRHAKLFSSLVSKDRAKLGLLMKRKTGLFFSVEYAPAARRGLQRAAEHAARFFLYVARAGLAAKAAPVNIIRAVTHRYQAVRSALQPT